MKTTSATESPLKDDSHKNNNKDNDNNKNTTTPPPTPPEPPPLVDDGDVVPESLFGERIAAGAAFHRFLAADVRDQPVFLQLSLRLEISAASGEGERDKEEGEKEKEEKEEGERKMSFIIQMGEINRCSFSSASRNLVRIWGGGRREKRR